MDDDDRAIARRLLAAATAMLEDALEGAVAGQSPRLDTSGLADHGCRLQAATQDIAALAKAATIVSDRAVNHAADERKDRRKDRW